MELSTRSTRLAYAAGALLAITTVTAACRRDAAPARPTSTNNAQRAANEASEGGTGTRHAGPEGRMGSRSARYAIRNNGEPPHMSRRAAREQTVNRGVFSALGAPAGGAPGAPSAAISPFGGLTESGVDDRNARGNMTGSSSGDAFGYGGLGAHSTGAGGGGRGTIGLGNLGTMGHGSGTGSGQGYGAGASRATMNARTPAAYAAHEERLSALPAVDPNGRFATTYRPGHGYLAAFEASMATGRVPESARELVGDLGARYAPDLNPPAQGALAHRVDLERGALPPAGGLLRLRVALRSTPTPATARPPMSVHLVLDASGSMSGASIDNARIAARSLVERLAPSDTFSLVRFSSEAEVLVRAGPVGPRRASILRTIETIQADGGTNIADGLSRGYAQAGEGPQGADVVRIVMLLSDGRASAGDSRPEYLRDLAGNAFQRGIQTSAFGVGTDYDGPLMASIAERGAGGYYYLPDSARIANALATELDARAQPVAQGVEVRVRLRDDVQLVQTYGSRRLDAREAVDVRAQEIAVDNQVARRDHIAQDRQHDRDGGMRFFIPGFARDDRHVILLGLRLPAGSGERPVATVELRYKDRLLGRNVITEVPVRARYADSDAASLATLEPSVARTVQGFDAGETLVTAARAIEAGDRPRAAALLTEREEVLRAAQTRLNEPRLGEDAARIARFRELSGGTGELSEPLVLALLLDTSARGYMH